MAPLSPHRPVPPGAGCSASDTDRPTTSLLRRDLGEQMREDVGHGRSDAPKISDDGHPTPEEEQRLDRHYSLDHGHDGHGRRRRR
jgi:hypothetical protein